jgi:phosphoribosylamine--glycine ligase
MRVLLVGNGAREHAIFKALQRSSHKPEIVVFGKSKNPGMLKESIAYEVGDIEDMELLKEIAKKYAPDFAFIGPENPIGSGAADHLESIGIRAVAPKQVVAQLESSKSFTRNLVSKHNIKGNPKFKNFKSGAAKDEIIKYITDELGGEYVVKYDGLLAGKGVKVSGEHLTSTEEGADYALECLTKIETIVIEEKLVGPEFSLMSFADGKNIASMPAVQDHKRAYDGDTGPNTGGMGTYSDANHLLPFLSEEDVREAIAINQMTLSALKDETGVEFKGIMYGGFMKTATGIKLIEYNARFGDPEAMNTLPILETDFVEICLAMLNGDLANLQVKFKPQATVCLYVVPEGYPGPTSKNADDQIIRIKKHCPDAEVFFASVDLIEETLDEYILKMSSSRALAFIGIADTIDEALSKARLGLATIGGKVAFRTDIGTKALIQKRIDLVNSFK